MGDFLKWLIAGVVPPRTSDDVLYRWQTAVAASIYAGLFSIVAIVTLSFGLSPFYSGFAQASDEKATKEILQQILDGQKNARILLVRAEIASTRERECKVDRTNVDALGFANEQLSNLRREYFSLTNQYPDLPPCELL